MSCVLSVQVKQYNLKYLLVFYEICWPDRADEVSNCEEGLPPSGLGPLSVVVAAGGGGPLELVLGLLLLFELTVADSAAEEVGADEVGSEDEEMVVVTGELELDPAVEVVVVGPPIELWFIGPPGPPIGLITEPLGTKKFHKLLGEKKSCNLLE